MLLDSHSSIRGLAEEAVCINKLKKIGFAVFDLPSVPCILPIAMTKTEHVTGRYKIVIEKTQNRLICKTCISILQGTWVEGKLCCSQVQ